MKKINIYLKALSISAFISAFIFLPYLISGRGFILGWDMQTLYSSNFENLRTMIQELMNNKILPFWSWSSFLGNDFYSSKLFYFQDIFDYPFALTNLLYSDIIMIQTFLKFMIATLVFVAYGKYHKYSDTTILIGSTIFTFSAYNLQTMMHPFFGSFFIFLPLYFLAIDRYVLEKKYLLFIFTVFFLFFNNYYLFYSVTLFSPIYLVYCWNKEHSHYYGFFKCLFRLIGYYSIGILLAMPFVLPEILSILSNSRVGVRSNTLYFDSLIPYLNYLTGIFTPTSILANRNTAISNLYSFTTKNHSVLAVFTWASSIVSLLIITSLKNCKKNIKLLIVITAIAMIPFLSSVMHGFSEPSFRWLASPSLLLIIMVLPTIENIHSIERKSQSFLFISILILQIILPFLLLHFSNMFFDEIKSEIFLSYLTIPTFTLTFIFLIFHKKSMLLLVAIIELCIVSYFSFYGNPAFNFIEKSDFDRMTHILGVKNEFENFIKKVDSSNEHQFYRTYIDPQSIYWGYSTNYNLYFNIKGLMAYDSTYISSANDLKLLDKKNVEDYLPWTFNIKNPSIMTLVSTKYAIVQKEDEVPFKNYTFVSEYYGMKIYRNDDYFNFGKTYSNLIKYDEYKETKDYILEDTIVAHKEDIKEISSYIGNSSDIFDQVFVNGNDIWASISTTEKGFAVTSIPYHKGWSVKVNNHPQKTYSVSGGLLGFALESGFNEVTFHFSPIGLKQGIYLFLLGSALLLITIVTHFIRGIFHAKK